MYKLEKRINFSKMLFLIIFFTLAVYSKPSMAVEILLFQTSEVAGSENFKRQYGWVEEINEKLEKELEIVLLSVNSIVPFSDTLEAIKEGKLDGHIADPSFFSKKEPAFGLIGNPVGAWQSPRELFDFMENGGGKELMDELYQPYGIKYIGATTPGLESLISTRPIKSLEDMKNLRIRVPGGMVESVFSEIGATPIVLAGSEAYSSLERGDIEAADYSVFSTNHAQGFHDIARHPIYPGFHSMPLVDIAINKKIWEGFTFETRKVFIDLTKSFAKRQVAEVKSGNLASVALAREGGVVTVHNLSQKERLRFKKIAVNEWFKVSAESTMSKKVYNAINEYLTENGLI